MYIVSITYQKGLEVVESHLAAHVAFLGNYYARGVFIASGRKVPRTGGVILAKGVSRSELEEILEQDPFKSHGVAVYEITEFAANMTAPGFSNLMDI